MTQLLTDSRLRAFRRCPREEQIKYQLGYRARSEDEALRFGSLMHLALEAWWRASDDRLEAALAQIVSDDPFETAKADALMRGYHARWCDERYETIAVEHPFRLPLINPATGAVSRTWDLAGKVDALARAADGRAYVVEHKTTSQDCGPGSAYLARLRLDSQVSMYLRAARELGHDPAGVLYDVIKKPGLRPLKATPVESRKYTKQGALYANQRDTDETPDEYHARLVESIAENPEKYYQRATVVRLAAEVEEYERELWQYGITMRDFQREGIAPRNTDGCERYGRTCSFADVCAGSASLEDADRFEKVKDVHPELAVEDAA